MSTKFKSAFALLLMASALLPMSNALATNIIGKVILDEDLATGVTVNLVLVDGEAIASTQVTSNGEYEFLNVADGHYELHVVTDSVTTAQSKVTVDDTSPDIIRRAIWLVSPAMAEETFVISGVMADLDGRTYSNYASPDTTTEITFSEISTGERYVTDTSSGGQYRVSVPAGRYTVNYGLGGGVDVDGEGATDNLSYFYGNNLYPPLDISDDTVFDITIPIKEVAVNATFEGSEVDAVVRYEHFKSVTGNGILGTGSQRFYIASDTLNNNLVMVADTELELYATPHRRSTQELPVFGARATFSPLSSESGVDVLEIPLSSQGVIVNATFKDLDGNRLQGSCGTFALQSEEESATACSNSNGDATFYLSEGDYLFSHRNYRPAWDKVSSTTRFNFNDYLAYQAESDNSESYKTDAIEIVVPVFQLNGKVLREDGMPATNAEVRFENSIDEADYGNGRIGKVDTYHSDLKTDENGYFSLYVTPFADSFYVFEGSAEAKVPFDNIVQGDFLTVTLGQDDPPSRSVDGKAQLEGKIINFSGMNIPAETSLYKEMSNGELSREDYIETGSDGTFTYSDLEPGRYQMRIYPDIYESRFPLADDRSGFSISSQIFELTGTTEKEFVVPLDHSTINAVDLAGNPIPGIVVTDNSYANHESFGDAYGYFIGITDAQGQGLLTQMYQTSTKLSLRSPHYAPAGSLSIDSVFNGSWQFDIIYLDTVSLRDDDNDGIPNFYENILFRFNSGEPNEDNDGDTLTNLEEYLQGTIPYSRDTDRDSINDPEDPFPTVPLYRHPTDLNVDTDNDGYTNRQELLIGTNYLDENDFPMLVSDISVDDQNLQICIDSNVLVESVLYTAQLKHIDCESRSVASLEGLQNYTGLQAINLSDNQIVDTAPIANHSSLKSVGLDGNRIESIAFVRSLPNLTSLQVSVEAVEDFAPLYFAKKLTHLGLHHRSEESSFLTDLSFLLHMPKLTSLSLEGLSGVRNQIFKINRLTTLKSLFLSDVPVNNLRFLSSLKYLTELTIDNIGDVGFSPLARLKNLETLNVSENELDDLEFLQFLYGLSHLNVSKNEIQNLSDLINLTQLEYLDLRFNPITCTDVSTAFSSINQLPVECFDKDSDGDGTVDRLDDDDDNDGMSDAYEKTYGLDSLDDSDAALDNDGDGLTNFEEFIANTDPNVTDTDGDGVLDGFDSAPNDSNEGVATMFDVDVNEYEDLLFSSVASNTIVSIDSSSGSETQEIVMPASMTVSKLLAVPDITGDAQWEIVTLGASDADGEIWLLHDGRTGDLLHKVTYSGSMRLKTQLMAEYVLDTNGNRKAELLVLIEDEDGRNAYLLYDLGNASLIKEVLLPVWFDAKSMHTASDWTGNGSPEVVIYGTTANGGTHLWLKYDASSGTSLGQGGYPGWFTPIEVVMGPDIDNNGTKSVLSLGTTSGGAKVWLAQDTLTGARRRLGGFPGWLTPLSITMVKDPFGDDKTDLVVLAETNSGNKLWRRISTASGTIQRQRSLPSWLTPESINSVGDLNTNGEPEVLVYGESTSGRKVLFKADATTGEQLGTLTVPEDYVQLH